MAKLLPVTGLVATVLTPLLALLLTGPAMAILPLLAVVAGVFAILERGRAHLALGVVLVLAGLVLAYLAIPGGVSGESTTVAGDATWAQWFAVLGGALAALAVVASRWGAFSPSWLGPGAALLAAAGLALLAWKHASMGNPAGDAAVLYPAALLLLASGYPNLAALRGPAATATPAPAAAEPVPAEPAARKGTVKRKAE